MIEIREPLMPMQASQKDSSCPEPFEIRQNHTPFLAARLVASFPVHRNIFSKQPFRRLRAGLLLLLLPQGEQTDTRDLDDLEANTGNRFC